MTTPTRDDALAALAAAAGRGDVAIVDDVPSGVISIVSESGPPLRLVAWTPAVSPRAWLFDVVPDGPAGSVPEWKGYLVFGDSTDRLGVVHLGDDAAALAAHWPQLVPRLSPAELALLVARYFGRDAGVRAHQHVVVSVEELLAELVEPERDLDLALTPPQLADGTLRFFTYFIECTPADGEFRFGLCSWLAQWDKQRPLAWRAEVARRGMRGVRYSC